MKDSKIQSILNESFWFSDDAEEPHDDVGQAVARRVFSVYERLKTDYAWKYLRDLNSYITYVNTDVSQIPLRGADFGTFSNVAAGLNLSGMTLNIIASCVDTITSKIAKERPRVKFETYNGDDSAKKRGTNLTRFIDGTFHDTKLYSTSRLVFRDACIFGTGVIKLIITDDGTAQARVAIERVYPNEVFVDHADGRYGEPRSIYQARTVSRHELARLYPTFVNEIAAAASVKAQGSIDTPDDMVEVVEAWHLPWDDGTPGKHAICLSSCTLFSEEWRVNKLPFVFFRWKPALTGFWGLSLSDELYPIQREFNRLLSTMTLAQRLAIPRIFVANGSEVNLQSMKAGENGVGAIVRYTGTPPTVLAPNQIAPPDAYAFLWALKDQAYQISGISQVNAAGQPMQGVTSGAGLREATQIAAERFATVQQDWEQFFVNVAELVIDMCKAGFTGSTRVRLSGKDGMDELKWNEVDLKRDRFVMRAMDASFLPLQPAARVATVEAWAQAGVIDEEQMFDLMGVPDIEGTISLKAATYRAAVAQVTRIVEDHIYDPPTKYMNVATCLKVALQTYSRIQAIAPDQRDEQAVALLEEYMQDCLDLQKLAQPPPPPPQMAPPPGDPNAPPMLPPVAA